MEEFILSNTNETMIQLFEWYIEPNCSHWKKISNEAAYLSNIGITYAWLPPAYKGSGGIYDTGYGVYDLYDLGEFDQKGTIKTKYGSKEEYIQAIKILKGNGIKVLADIVFNHRLGADEPEEVIAVEYESHDRTISKGEPHVIKAWTKFNFPGRNNCYSDFKWNWTHFHGVDWDEIEQKNSIFCFYGRHWDTLVDKENGNFDYLMGCDVDLNNVDVVEELIKWAKWYLAETNVDGFRMDAVKHIRSSFFDDWLKALKQDASKDLFSVGEYWSYNIDALKNYISETSNMISLFDVPLHYNFHNACYSNGTYDMRTIFDNSLVKEMPSMAVTFVDNHDTQLGQSLESWISDWFKPLAYSLILLRKDGLPCVFYGDLYGIPSENVEDKKSMLEPLLKARKHFAYGTQIDYFDHPNIIGWVREGDIEHPDSGMAVLVTNGDGGNKIMNVGKRLANSTFYDCTGNVKEPVYVDSEGNGIFYVNGGSVSVWIKHDNMYNSDVKV